MTPIAYKSRVVGFVTTCFLFMISFLIYLFHWTDVLPKDQHWLIYIFFYPMHFGVSFGFLVYLNQSNVSLWRSEDAFVISRRFSKDIHIPFDEIIQTKDRNNRTYISRRYSYVHYIENKHGNLKIYTKERTYTIWGIKNLNTVRTMIESIRKKDRAQKSLFTDE